MDKCVHKDVLEWTSSTMSLDSCIQLVDLMKSSLVALENLMESCGSHLQFEVCGGPNGKLSSGSGEPNGEWSARTNAVKASSILKFTMYCCCGFKI